MATMSPTALAKALKRKFGDGPAGRAAVLARLALDESMLSAPVPPMHGSGDDGDKMAMRRAIEELLENSDSEHPDEKLAEKILAVLDKYAGNGEGARALAGDDEEEERREKFCEFLRQCGLSEADINAACDVAKGRGVGRDYAAGKPENVFQGGLRGQQIAGDAAIKHLVDRIVVEPNFGGDRRMSMAEATQLVNSRASAEAMFPDIKRIGHF